MNLGLKKHAASRSTKKAEVQLKDGAWEVKARRTLERVLTRGAGQGLDLVFDFDNTIISGDIGEAVLAILAKTGRLEPSSICETLCPDLPHNSAGPLQLRRCNNIMEYYEGLLVPTAHGKRDPTPLANGYVWATQVLERLKLSEVLEATRQVFQLGASAGRDRAAITVGNLKCPVPKFREEFVELLSVALRLGYRPWIVSASNVWSVRWMVVHELNPRLRKLGALKGLPAEQVIGLATLLSDSSGRLYKDSVLVREDGEYANFGNGLFNSLQVTRHIQFPAPVYSGKVACILDAIGHNPYLSAGDSPSDHPMLRVSKHRLWVERPDKPETQRLTRKLIESTGASGWIVHPVAALG